MRKSMNKMMDKSPLKIPNQVRTAEQRLLGTTGSSNSRFDFFRAFFGREDLKK
jgi:hypothetical protein